MNLEDLDITKLYTYADYLSWEFKERVELIKGKIFKMSPAPSREHQKISMTLSAKIFHAIDKGACEVYSAPFDVRLSNSDKGGETVVQPDISIICDQNKLDSRGCKGAPDLIIEILSPSTAGKDLREKKNLYEENGVFEYWAVEINDKLVFQYELIEGKYQQEIVVDGEVLQSKIFPDLKINLGEVFH